jgi:membrane-bound lytic murein transglycosylase B
MLILVLTPCEINKKQNGDSGTKQKISFFKPVVDSLLSHGADSNFVIGMVSHPNTKFDEKYVKINVTGYLKKPDYSANYNRQSVKKCRKFYRSHYQLLKSAAEKYSVPGNVITAILWIETKFGRYTGKHNLPSVYLSTALANQYEFIQMNLRELENLNIRDSVELDSLKRRIYQRAEKKARWAVEQLLYLDSSRTKLPQAVTEMKGSWAGAFGLCQFIPSSYYRWAVDGNSDGKIDLFDTEDAVMSIGNYLKTNGWSDNINDKKAALHHYNNSDDYVYAVLKLASKIK